MEYLESKTPIAILLGVYNGEKYLATQIESIIKQTCSDWSLYIRDDASTDNTLSIIYDFVSKYPNIYLVEDGKGNLGCNGNYFELMHRVKAPYYMFCNADDYWYEDKIELSYNKMKDAEKAFKNVPIIVNTDMSVGDANLNVVLQSNWNNLGHYNPERYKTYNYMGISCQCAGATLLFNDIAKENCFPEYKGKDLFFDHWLALKNVKQGKIVSVYKPTLIHRQIGSNMVGTRTKEQRTLKYKLTHLGNLWALYMVQARALKEIGWGGYVKFFWYKFLFTVSHL